jgi:hypothetical protein
MRSLRRTGLKSQLGNVGVVLELAPWRRRWPEKWQ